MDGASCEEQSLLRPSIDDDAKAKGIDWPAARDLTDSKRAHQRGRVAPSKVWTVRDRNRQLDFTRIGQSLSEARILLELFRELGEDCGSFRSEVPESLGAPVKTE